MTEKIIEELKNRKEAVERFDLEIQIRNKESSRNLWMNIIILSSAIIIGILPLLNENSNLIKSLVLAKLGLLLIIIIVVIGIIYYENVLIREKLMLSDLSQFHQETFAYQEYVINSSIKEKKDLEEIQNIFNITKKESFSKELKIREKHLVGGKFFRLRSLSDKYFSRFLCYGFAIALIIIIFSLTIKY